MESHPGYSKKCPAIVLPAYVTYSMQWFDSESSRKKLKIARMTQILKPGKNQTDTLSYCLISNLNSVEKVVESLMKTQLDKFMERNKIITPSHHGGQKLHLTLTAKMVIDTIIEIFWEQQMATGIISTYLSVANDAMGTMLLKTELEHLGIRWLELELICTYLEDRYAFVEIQGYQSKLKLQPTCSVTQGSKLTSIFHTTYMLDITEVDQIMNETDLYKL